MKTEEKIEHELFDISIVLKGIHALVETVSGILIYLVSSSFIFRFVNIISFGELTENPIDSFSQYLLNLTHSFSGGTKEFVALRKNLKNDNKKSLLVVNEPNKSLYLSSRNLADSKVVTASELNTYSILDTATLLLTEGSIDVLEKNFSI